MDDNKPDKKKVIQTNTVQDGLSLCSQDLSGFDDVLSSNKTIMRTGPDGFECTKGWVDKARVEYEADELSDNEVIDFAIQNAKDNKLIDLATICCLTGPTNRNVANIIFTALNHDIFCFSSAHGQWFDTTGDGVWRVFATFDFWKMKKNMPLCMRKN